MFLVDKLLEDEQFLDTVYEPQRGTPSPEPHSCPNANARRSIVALAVVEASWACELDAKSNKSGAESTGRSEAVAASSHSSGRSDAITGDDGGESSASSETDADADFRSDTKVTGKDRERVLTAHENYRKGKASKRNEFGKLVKIQEAENQIVPHFEVHADRPADSTQLLSSLQVNQQRLGRIPRMVAADAGFYPRENEKAGKRWAGGGCRCPIRKPQLGETSSAPALVS
jgi:hypothetical protein